MVLQSLQKMRIVAIPLTRPPKIAAAVATVGAASTSTSNSPNTSANSHLNRLTYYQFQISGNKGKGKDAAGGAGGVNARKKAADSEGWRAWPAQIREEGIVDWSTQKATDVWSGFGKAKGGWKLKLYNAGEKLVDRMEFEELALKSVDPRLAPGIVRLATSDEGPKARIPLVFPPSQLSAKSVLAELKAYTLQRIPRHRKGFYFWMILAPFTAPFMIIPIIPNLPFFFCVWRSWSHYRAYKASEYLSLLLTHNILVPEPNSALDEVYRHRQLSSSSPTPTPLSKSRSSPLSVGKPTMSKSKPQSLSASAGASAEPSHTLLITRPMVPHILSILDLSGDSTAAVDIYRAVDQAKVRVESGKLGL